MFHSSPNHQNPNVKRVLAIDILDHTTGKPDKYLPQFFPQDTRQLFNKSIWILGAQMLEAHHQYFVTEGLNCRFKKLLGWAEIQIPSAMILFLLYHCVIQHNFKRLPNTDVMLFSYLCFVSNSSWTSYILIALLFIKVTLTKSDCPSTLLWFLEEWWLETPGLWRLAEL